MTATSEGSSPDEIELFARCGRELLDAVDATLGSWVERSVRVTAQQLAGSSAVTDGLLIDARSVADSAHREVIPALRALVDSDAEAQRVNPLQILREAVCYPTAVLAGHGIPPARRDVLQRAALPSDVYDIAPATWGDIDASLVEPGIRWSAAKAYVVLARRRRMA